MPDMRLAERLAGTHILLTGVTGFVGEALLLRLLRDVPGCRVTALVRPRPGRTAEDRVRRLLRKPVFAGLPEDTVQTRMTVLAGDLAHVPRLPDDLDVVVHCAGEVSFDPTIDEAFGTNVVGTRNLLERVREAAGVGGEGPTRALHYVHVSTAYVGGRRRGPVPEARVDTVVDWRAELAAAERVSQRCEDDSRTPERLGEFLDGATRDHERAGPIAIARAAEEARLEWVSTRRKEAGAERARSLGWTDAYTFTKALGERVVEEMLGEDLPVTVYRPSIIESALRQPHPGWIEGFKMAEPLILAHGRGELPDFPASPDSVVDIVPVDLVVNSIVAAAATPPPVGEPAYLHLCSGARNPLTFRDLEFWVREYFAHHPFEADDRGAVQMPQWQFPGADRVERTLVRAERLHRVAERALSWAPRSERVRGIAQDLDRQRQRLDQLRRYMDLYRAYTQTELHFVDDRMLAMHRALDPADVEQWGFDTAVVDWREYLVDIHCPAITATVREHDRLRRRRARLDEGGGRRLVRAEEEASPVLAVFDMDGTLLSSNVIETYLWMRLPELSAGERIRELASLAAQVPGLLRAERRDRGGLLRSTYRRYEGASLAGLESFVDECATSYVLERVSADAVRRVREHRAAGHRTVLVTGAVRPLTRPLAPLFDEVVAAELAVDEAGRCTGFLTRPPLVGEARAAWLREYARQEGADLSRSYGYADSHSDLPLLQEVGLPTAVSPDVTLYRAARRSRWPIVTWRTSAATPRFALPG